MSCPQRHSAQTNLIIPERCLWLIWSNHQFVGFLLVKQQFFGFFVFLPRWLWKPIVNWNFYFQLGDYSFANFDQSRRCYLGPTQERCSIISLPRLCCDFIDSVRPRVCFPHSSLFSVDFSSYDTNMLSLNTK